jgi:hypothetical protein
MYLKKIFLWGNLRIEVRCCKNGCVELVLAMMNVVIKSRIMNQRRRQKVRKYIVG